MSRHAVKKEVGGLNYLGLMINGGVGVKVSVVVVRWLALANTGFTGDVRATLRRQSGIIDLERGVAVGRGEERGRGSRDRRRRAELPRRS
jgi:hypothetical protein